MNIFTVGTDGKKRRISGEGISMPEAIKRMEETQGIIPLSKTEKAIYNVIATNIENSEYCACIELKSTNGSGDHLRLCHIMVEDEKPKEIAFATYNLDSVNSQKFGNTVLNAIIDHQSKKEETLRQSG